MTNLNNITDFFLPNRQVWQNAEVAGGNADTDSDADITDTDTDTEIDTDFDTESRPDEEAEDDKIDAALDFADQTCQFVQKEGESAKTTAEKQVCSMRSELDKVKGLKSFVDELFVKFLVKGEGYKNEKDTFKRLQILKNECDMDRIIKCFEKARGYKINLYTDSQLDKNPDLIDHIVFTYKDGSQETVNLELNVEEKINVFTPAAQGVRRAEAISDRQAAEDRWRKSHPMYDPWAKWRAKYEGPRPMADPWKKWRAEYENVGQNAQDEKSSEGQKESPKGHDKKPNPESVNTPKKAYSRLKEIAPNVPDDLLSKLSVPLSNFASNPSDGESQYEMINEIFRKYYGVRGYFDIRDIDPVAFNELRKIWKNFDF